MIRKHILFAVIMLLFLNVSAQKLVKTNVEFIKENFPDKKSELKDVLRELKEADEYFQAGEGQYQYALPLFLKANNFNPKNAKVNYKIGKCYLSSGYKLQALPYFEKAYQLDEEVDTDIHFMLAQSYHLNSEWDKAMSEYAKHRQSLGPGIPKNQVDVINKKIEECKTGKELVKTPVRVFNDNLGNVINTKFPEYGPVISADESVMMFTSRRDNTTEGKIDENIGQYFEDIYITYNIDGKWLPPKNMPKPVNTEGHDAVIGLSPDGQKLLIYKDDKGDGNIYESVLRGEEWTKPKKLDKTINTTYHESSACYSYDGKTLYFVSKKPEGSFGGRDIYRSTWDEKKERWKEAVNLGPQINTPYDEEAVFMLPDGKTMYFSSKGHNNIGGFDIFKSTYQNSKWSEPENIGYPINTADDDVFFVMAANGTHAYYASLNPGGYGEKDIYKMTFLGPEKQVVLNTEDNLLASKVQPVKEIIIEKQVEVSKNKITLLKGLVTDAHTKQAVEAKIDLVNNTKSEQVAEFESNSKTGKYLIALPSGVNYGIAVRAEGYLFHSENFDIPETAAYQEIVKNIELQKIEVGAKVILKNIFFDFDKYTLRTESTIELNRVVTLMIENPSIKIEISGHTDNKGSDTYNQRLSEDRAKAVVEYLIKQGISKDRMTYKGYGKVQPIATNDTEEGRQLNRRTEFKIMAK